MHLIGAIALRVPASERLPTPSADAMASSWVPFAAADLPARGEMRARAGRAVARLAAALHWRRRPRRARILRVVGDAIPASLTGAKAIPRGPGDRGQPAGRALPALPQRTVPGGAVPGHPGARPRRRRNPLVGEGSCGCGSSIDPPQSGDHHAALLPDRGLTPRRPAFAGKTGVERRTDRGRGSLPGDAEGSEATKIVTMKPSLCCAANPAATRRRFLIDAPAFLAGGGRCRGISAPAPPPPPPEAMQAQRVKTSSARNDP